MESLENTRIQSKPLYLPGLNGLRAIAALAVVFSHITLGLDLFGLDNRIFNTDENGNASGLSLAAHGVTIFFTLSGFLITFLLLKEKEVSQIKVKKFYIRRILRIWPLYYLYFALALLTIACFNVPFVRNSIPFYVFIAANVPFMIGSSLPFLSHYWSLGVEEQFYLFFPHLAKVSNQRFLKIVIILIATFLFLRLVSWIMLLRFGYEMPFRITGVMRFHSMLIGALVAILYYLKNKRLIYLATHKLTQATAWFVIFLLAINKFHIASIVDGELISVVAAVLIMGQITRSNLFVDLENKVCDFIGRISYGIYVVHPLLIFLFSKLIGKFAENTTVNYVIVYASIIGATIVLSYVSYEYYEKRFLRLKKKYAVVESSNAKVDS